MHSLLKNNLSEVERIMRTHHVERAYAFGSVCTDKFTDKSDVDFIIKFNDDYFDDYADNFLNLEDSLKALLKREVDVITERTLRNPYFIKEVEKTKTKIYE